MRSSASFSRKVKDELARHWSDRPCCIKSELAAFLRLHGLAAHPEAAKDRAVTVSAPSVARKLYRLIKAAGFDGRLHIQRGDRHPQRRAYRVEIDAGAAAAAESLSQYVPTKRCCRRAYMRGAYLSRGSLSAPERAYHFEISADPTSIDAVADVLTSLGLAVKTIRRQYAEVVYLKDSEQIVEALNLMEAYSASLSLENLRIIKGMRNQVNRLVNSETANVGKTVHAAVQQLDAIRLIDDKEGLESLSPRLSQVARLRVEFPYASLSELGRLLTPQLTKSGVNYRMGRIVEHARQLEENIGGASEGNGETEVN